MLRLDNDKIRELIANAGDTSNLGNAYSAKKILQDLLFNSSILLTKEQRININKALSNLRMIVNFERRFCRGG